VANPFHLQSLFNLLLLASPRVKLQVLKIVQNLIRISIPLEIFEETVSLAAKDPSSHAAEILSKMDPQIKFKQSKFLQFLFNYMLSLRQKMWSKTGIECKH